MPNIPTFSTVKLNENIIVCLWMIFCFVALTYKLGEVPPYHADENFYVESALRMVESGDYVTPVYHEKNRFAKPILYYWMVVSSFKVFDVSLFSARFPSVIFGTLSIGLIFLLGKILFNRRVGLFSAFILPSTYLHFQISRWSTTDMALNFFILFSTYIFVLMCDTKFEKKYFSYLFYLSLGLGFMIKGPPAILIPGLTILGFLIFTKRKNWFNNLCIFEGLIILSIIILPWFITMYWMHGEEFKNHILGNEIKNRLVHDTPFSFYYVGVLIRYQLPWSLLLIFSALKQCANFEFVNHKGVSFNHSIKALNKNIREYFQLFLKDKNEPVIFCCIWILVCLVLFTLLRVEHSRYMLPSCPAIAILTARIFAEMEENSFRKSIFGFWGITILTLFVFFIFSVLAGATIFKLESVPIEIYFLPAFLIFGAILLACYFSIQSLKKLVITLAFVMVVIFTSLSGDVIPFVNRYPMKKFANQIHLEKFKGPIGVYQLGSHRARLGILTGRTVVTLHSPEEVGSFLETRKKIYMVIKESDWEKYFSKSELNIINKDQIIKKTKKIISQDLWELDKIRKALGLTETVYLISNN